VTASQIVSPSDAAVLEPTAQPTLVLTTCNPRFSASQRLVVFARRVSSS
jgi:sortase (surface protein transpeptidase)